MIGQRFVVGERGARSFGSMGSWRRRGTAGAEPACQPSRQRHRPEHGRSGSVGFRDWNAANVGQLRLRRRTLNQVSTGCLSQNGSAKNQKE